MMVLKSFTGLFSWSSLCLRVSVRGPVFEGMKSAVPHPEPILIKPVRRDCDFPERI